MSVADTYDGEMAKQFITAHIKLEDDVWQRLGSHASHHDLSTAQLVRRVIEGWLASQVIGAVDDLGPWSLQDLGQHSGFSFFSKQPRRVPPPIPEIKYNEHGVRYSEHICQRCGSTFTITPASPEFRFCGSSECSPEVPEPVSV